MVYVCLTLLLIFTTGVLSQWDKCPPCKCEDYNEYWRAYCDESNARSEISEIPLIKKPNVKLLSMNNQPLRTLPDKVFSKVGLVKLVYLFLMQCKINLIEEQAFFGLKNLIVLDISLNKITYLERNTFSPLTNLKELKMGGNNLFSIGNGLLLSLSSLETIDLNSNKLTKLNNNIFPNSTTLSCINLSKNNITYMNTSTIEHLKLQSLQLHDNPWNCDCQLRDLHEIIKKKRVTYAEEPKCTTPFFIKDKKWTKLKSEDFNCWLHVIYRTQFFEISLRSKNVTIPCLYSSSPFAHPQWSFRNRTIIPSAKYKFTFRQVDHVTYWHNLTITKVAYEDMGEYRCTVMNLAGVQEVVIQLAAPPGRKQFSYVKWVVLVTVTCIIFIGSILVMLIKCFVRYSAINNMEHEYQESRQNLS